MKMRGRIGQIVLMATGAAIAIVAYEAGRARADGAPTDPAKEPLVYSGYLEADGAPVKDLSRETTVTLYGASDGTDVKCSVTKSVNTVAGHFRIALDKQECLDAVHANPNLWIGVKVEDNEELLSKIAAVPYAIEATNAATADALTPAALEELKKTLSSPEVAYPPCPPGYGQVSDDGVAWTNPGSATAPEFVVCTAGSGVGAGKDQVVLVGKGATSFWIDRYEATLWDESGTLLGGPSPEFPTNGQVPRGKELYAFSVPNLLPTGNLTWFQMAEACAASGKRLPTSTEWLRAGRGTYDPGAVDGHGKTQCHTAAPQNDLTPRTTNKAIGASKDESCVSDWGAEDMIGNFYEMIENWHVPPGVVTTDPGTEKVTDEHKNSPWSAGFNQDITLNVASKVTGAFGVDANGQLFGIGSAGLPAAEIRGGAFAGGLESGLFYIGASTGPSVPYWVNGFRCMIPR